MEAVCSRSFLCRRVPDRAHAHTCLASDGHLEPPVEPEDGSRLIDSLRQLSAEMNKLEIESMNRDDAVSATALTGSRLVDLLRAAQSAASQSSHAMSDSPERYALGHANSAIWLIHL